MSGPAGFLASPFSSSRLMDLNAVVLKKVETTPPLTLKGHSWVVTKRPMSLSLQRMATQRVEAYLQRWYLRGREFDWVAQ